MNQKTITFDEEELNIIHMEISFSLAGMHKRQKCDTNKWECPYDHYTNQVIAADMQSILAKVREASGS